MAIPLCQSPKGLSCAACCGIYNLRLGRPGLEALLGERTDGVGRAGQDEGVLARLVRGRLEAEAGLVILSDVRVCPLAGFVGPGRVGCLVHPAVLGRDLRFLGVHDPGLCRDYLCAGHGWLRETEADLLARACGDWYIYGLAVADVGLLKGSLRLAADRIGRMPGPRELQREAVAQALAPLLALKGGWPQGGGGPWETMGGPIAPYSPSPYLPLLRSLGLPHGQRPQHEAEIILEGLLAGLAEALEPLSRGQGCAL